MFAVICPSKCFVTFLLHTNDQATPCPSTNDEFAKNPDEGVEKSNKGALSNKFESQDQETVSIYGRKRKPKRDKIYEYCEWKNLAWLSFFVSNGPWYFKKLFGFLTMIMF